MTTNIVGIDKISLTTTDFRIERVSEFNVGSTIKQGQTEPNYLLTDLAGKPVYADKLYRNDKIGKYEMALSINVSQKGLLIQFNPNKYNNPYKLTEPNTQPYNECLMAVKGVVNELGIKVTYESMSVCRIDLAKQPTMNLQLHSYAPAFGLMNFKSMNKTVYDGVNSLHKTDSKQYGFYDKIRELIKDNKGSFAQGERNLLRGEVRFMNKKIISQLIGCNNLYELNSLSPADLANIYHNDLSKLFGKIKEGKQTVIDYENQVDLLKNYYKKLRGGVIDWLWQIEGSLGKSIESIGGYTMLKEILKEAGYKNITNTMNDIKEKVLMVEMIKKQTKTHNLYDLFIELKLKFAS